MSKITNDGLTRFGTECFIAVPIWRQWRQRVLTHHSSRMRDVDYLRLLPSLARVVDSVRLAVAVSQAATVVSRRPTRRPRSSSRVEPSRRPRSWPSRTPSTPGSWWTGVTADRWTPTAGTTAPCRPLRRRHAFTASLSAVLHTYTASSPRLTVTANSMPVKTFTLRSEHLPVITVNCKSPEA